MHKAAKKAFDEANLTKPPTVKSLQTEFAELLTQKKSAYAQYRAARDEMRELLIQKANVERILREDAPTTEKQAAYERK